MVASIQTVAFEGIEALPVEVQVQISNGLPAFTIVGLPDKAVTEARERVRSALAAIGTALPAERITVNLSPADRPKAGSHYDLPVILAILTGMGVLPADCLEDTVVMGELGLDASIRPVPGILPAAMYACGEDATFICPAASGGEAAWAGGGRVVAAPDVLSLVNHLRGRQILPDPEPDVVISTEAQPDLVDIKGQESAKRALEIAAAGGHSLLMVGPPGAGKSMLASRLPSLLPPLTPKEALEVSMIASVAGKLTNGSISLAPPFRSPHHSASQPALVGGGTRALPGEVSLAHTGALFMDELPEFSRNCLEALRQPVETGTAVVARAQAHITYPARFQLIAAMNPCKCGYLDDAGMACSRAPKCALDYQGRISGPLFDRFDLFIDVPAVSASDLMLSAPRETSADVAVRVKHAREVQQARAEKTGQAGTPLNARADGKFLEGITALDAGSKALLDKAVDHFHLSARGYHRVLRVSRTIADLVGSEAVYSDHIAEALAYRRINPQAANTRAVG